jgi:hypothetical protein
VQRSSAHRRRSPARSLRRIRRRGRHDDGIAGFPESQLRRRDALRRCHADRVEQHRSPSRAALHSKDDPHVLYRSSSPVAHLDHQLLGEHTSGRRALSAPSDGPRYVGRFQGDEYVPPARRDSHRRDAAKQREETPWNTVEHSLA